LHLAPAAAAGRLSRFTQDNVFQPPHVSFAAISGSPSSYIAGHYTNVTYSNMSLPANVQLMTVQYWAPMTLLLRLSHQFGVDDDATLSQPATVDLAAIFRQATITAVTELSLTANQGVNDHNRLKWNTTSSANTVRPNSYLQSTSVTLTPLQIRTFAITFA